MDDIAVVMQGISIDRAHVVGRSMGGDAALQFGLRYPEKASAIVAAGAGSGSPPSQREAWLKEHTHERVKSRDNIVSWR